PPTLVAWPLQRVTLSFARRHREVFARLGRHAAQTYLIDPLDLPFAFRLRPRPARPTLEVLHRPVARGWDARIAGRLSALLGMVHGTLDGDALFFSRDLVVEGDVEAVLALRNALDDAEVDLVSELLAVLGPAGARFTRLGRAAMLEASRLTGVALARPEP
ncbi:MAG: ubiquinone anaerobic biosynthesis accessory factor UbiT, partial [Bacteroidota bacterium]|nr:SCP2 sterol-binding domain-containing protein [Kiloniellaceae bacterium]